MRLRGGRFGFLGAFASVLLFMWYLTNEHAKRIGVHENVAINFEHSCDQPPNDGIVRRDSGLCGNSSWPSCCVPVFLIIVVFSAPNNLVERTAIRNSWARMPQGESLNSQYHGVSLYNGKNLVKTVFLLGQVEKEALRQLVRIEAKQYGDIVIGSFIDSYRNLTLKIKLGLTWAYLQCNFKYLLKTDDDSFVNTIGLVKRLWNSPRKNFYFGRCSFGAKVVRKRGHKWAVSRELYENDTYPPYCVGAGYVLTSDVVVKIMNVIESEPLLPVEDAYVGLLLHKLNIYPVHSGPLFKDKKYNFAGNFCQYKHVLLAHKLTTREILNLHLQFMNINTCT